MKKVLEFLAFLKNRNEEYGSLEEVYSCQAIISLSFGSNNSLSNKYLSKIVLKIISRQAIPPILQGEVAECLHSNFLNIIKKNRKYLDTYEVCKQANEVCLKNDWKKIAIVAHPDHAWRVNKTLKKMRLETVIVNTNMVPYDKRSKQFWTRRRFFFIFREILVIIYYSIRKII
ncbi:hypothetical protein CVU82_01785 [Candidatus Falkowbacteria bacterium HGW-Falkowbacteria-1]|jgi:uncharacterized SAM-binding protein YcdF (DUF218 family)|uniref:DUF218 domain-containing protein n=1 Tax=Candidatus Falkowbacteria bacterium HGW-Falkowbacteria-1 TaxID=2013768 RepID=A0A2N2E9A2_9BACT|nr:MAG: hypothetical protein CVU82_01785 [Candidatus Falkowbacteria bacterium HGW-Falkowbacteria-1]